MRKFPIAVVLGVAALALTACTAPSSTSTSTGGSASTVTDLKIGNFTPVPSWDPAQGDIGFNGPYYSAVYDSLVEIKPDGTPIPSFATKWKVSDDGTKIDFTLRTGVKFSDGTDVDADAVVASLEHYQKSPTTADAYSFVSGISKIDATTVEVQLKQRDDTLLYFMGLGRSYIMSPKALADGTLATTPDGSGPYKLDASTVAGSKYVFDKVSGHWNAKLYPWKNLTILAITDATARNNAMLSGQINVNYAAESDTEQTQAANWNVAKEVAGYVGLDFLDHTGAQLKPLGDVRVRQALNYAFDGAGILKAVGKGAGKVANQVFPVTGTVYDSSLNDTYSYDVAKAKSLLADAGYGSGFSLHLPMSPVFQQWQAVAEQSFKDVGITVTWDNMQYSDYAAKAPTYPMFITFIAMDSNPLATVHRAVSVPQWYNPKPDYTSDSDISGLVTKIDASTGSDQLALIKQLNTALVKKAWFDIWYQSDNIYVSAKGIKVTPVVGMMFPTLRYIQQG